MISDVPLGAFLSGDRFLVCGRVDERASTACTTCSIGFTEAAYNEANAGGCRQPPTNHFERIVESRDRPVRKLAWHRDEPFADSSAVPTYYVSKVARQHVTVALSGDGGDENFAGYRRYKLDLWENRLRSYVSASTRRAMFGPLGRLYPKMDWAPRMFRAKTTFQSLARSPLEGYFHGISFCPPELKQQLLGPDVGTELRGYDSMDVMRAHYDRAGTLTCCRASSMSISRRIWSIASW